MSGPLTDAQISQWNNKGYVVVSGLLEPTLVEKCTQIMLETFKDKACKDFGSEGKCEFPTSSDLDKVTMNEELIDGVCQLLQTKDILLTQVVVLAYYKLFQHSFYPRVMKKLFIKLYIFDDPIQ